MGRLLLARKTGESVILLVAPSTEPTPIVVTLGWSQRHGDRLEIEAPQHVNIARSEIAKQEASK